ncbi:MAG: YdeI/OmpD-associated family protein [Ignavibacteriae bacterium]|nr:YdeI/OmpD-associated family protein [Ignavibacteriota bacterium]
MNPIFFSNQTEFRKWLEQNHTTETELIVGYYKVGTGKPNMTWSESVDQALCFGWIDGVRRSVDTESYCIRFTPRKPTSIWSDINIKKMEELTKAGLMQPAGLAIFEKRKEDKSSYYTYIKEELVLPGEYEKIFKENHKAWEFFIKQAPSYRKVIIYRIVSAKQESTRLSRLKGVIEASEQQRRMF